MFDIENLIDHIEYLKACGCVVLTEEFVNNSFESICQEFIDNYRDFGRYGDVFSRECWNEMSMWRKKLEEKVTDFNGECKIRHCFRIMTEIFLCEFDEERLELNGELNEYLDMLELYLYE